MDYSIRYCRVLRADSILNEVIRKRMEEEVGTEDLIGTKSIMI